MAQVESLPSHHALRTAIFASYSLQEIGCAEILPAGGFFTPA
jgi:hypothetical protein